MSSYTYWSNSVTKKPKHYTADLIKKVRRYEIKFYTYFDEIVDYLIMDVDFDKTGQIDMASYIIKFETRFNIKLDQNYIDKYQFERDRGYISYINKIQLTPEEMTIFKNALRKEKLISIMNKLKKDE